jgi:hypothetical protein
LLSETRADHKLDNLVKDLSVSYRRSFRRHLSGPTRRLGAASSRVQSDKVKDPMICVVPRAPRNHDPLSLVRKVIQGVPGQDQGGVTPQKMRVPDVRVMFAYTETDACGFGKEAGVRHREGQRTNGRRKSRRRRILISFPPHSGLGQSWSTVHGCNNGAHAMARMGLQRIIGGSYSWAGKKNRAYWLNPSKRSLPRNKRVE